MQDFQFPVHVMRKVVIKPPIQRVEPERTESPGISEGKDGANVCGKQIFMRGIWAG